MGVFLVPCLLVPLSDFCSGPLLVANVGSREDGGWFPADTGGCNNTSCARSAEFWMLVLAV